MLDGVRICHFSTVHSVTDARVRERECIGLARTGADVHLFAVGDRDETCSGLTIHGLKRKDNRIVRFLTARQCLDQVMELEPHIIHFHDPELISVMLKTNRKKRSTKVVFDCHEDSISHVILKEYIPGAVKPLVKTLVASYFRKAAAQCDAVITADEETGRLFRQWGADPVVLYNFPPRAVYEIEPEWTYKTRPYDLIYPGSVPRYHLEIMFRIALELKKRGRNCRWLILTRLIFPDASQWVEDRIRFYGIEGLFDFLPPVPLPQLPHFLGMARIGIIPLPDTPKFRRNIPSKLFDYFLAGLPVVMSDLPPSRSFLQDRDIAVPVSPDNPEAYASAICGLLDDESWMRNMGQDARATALREYTWETQMPKLIKLYSALMGEETRRTNSSHPGTSRNKARGDSLR